MSYKTIPAKWFVATYGDMGLQVELFACPLAYGRAVRAAQLAHERGYDDMGEIDTYTHGDLTLMVREAEVAA